MDRLTEDGVLVFHISDRYDDIHKPLARAAEALGLTTRKQHYAGNTAVGPGAWRSGRGPALEET